MALQLSVVTPTYNDANYLKSNLKFMAEQEYDNFEHIVVDGGSEDETHEILDKWGDEVKNIENNIKFKWVNAPGCGIYDAIEIGFDHASGDIYSWLNADDRWFPWTTTVVTDVFEHSDAEWITGHPARIDDEGKLTHIGGLRPQYRQSWIRKGWYYGNGLGYIQQESTFWTNSLWERAGGFPDDLELAGDYWLWRQFAAEVELFTIDTILAAWRRRCGKDSQLSDDKTKYNSEVERSFIAEIMGEYKIHVIYSLMMNYLSSPTSLNLEGL